MAVPSAASLSSLVFVMAAGMGFVAVSSNTSDEQPEPAATAPSTAASTTISQSAPSPKPKSTRPGPVDVVPEVLVEVYNNSGVTGLAADKARVLEAAGWNVAATDNWYGNISESTVYHPPRLESQATKLAKTLHIIRVRPAVSPMHFDRLTVIFTAP
ncbi:MAG: LytR C-terminal domain-containing protein [Propionibacteriales bacterium]|nr:LytR C-terminal domain-containing protein [Propionibacteriales bacterium]